MSWRILQLSISVPDHNQKFEHTALTDACFEGYMVWPTAFRTSLASQFGIIRWQMNWWTYQIRWLLATPLPPSMFWRSGKLSSWTWPMCRPRSKNHVHNVSGNAWPASKVFDVRELGTHLEKRHGLIRTDYADEFEERFVNSIWEGY